jgi:PDZ domain-containing protein
MEVDDATTGSNPSPPPESPAAFPPAPAPAGAGAAPRRHRGWTIATSIATVVFLFCAAVFFGYHLNTQFIRPGDALKLKGAVKIDGAPTYSQQGGFLLLTVFEDSHPTIAQWFWDKYFVDHSVEEQLPKPTPVNQNQQSVCDMGDSQANAKYVALKRLGYKLDPLPGVVIQQISATAPAATKLQCGDTIDAIDGTPTPTPQVLQTAIRKHKPGESAQVTYRRGGKQVTEAVPLACLSTKSGDVGPSGGAVCSETGIVPAIGVLTEQRYKFPINVSIDTQRITGPSGGLAMTLQLLDMLSPCDLTGGKTIAVTGEIDGDGNVYGIGGTPQKVIVAKHAGAKLFIVGANSDDLEQARKLAGKMPFVVVKTVDDALKALQSVGGQPLNCSAATKPA